MSLRAEMQRAAAAGVRALGRRASSVHDFLMSRVGPDGGFKGRADQEDLYYSAFGAEALIALEAEPPKKLPDFLRSFRTGDGLDLVHLSCLARCWTALPTTGLEARVRRALRRRLATFSLPDGGFAPVAGGAGSTAYACFLGAGACEDLGVELRGRKRFIQCLEHFRSADGGYANEAGARFGLTPLTAGMVVLRHHLGEPLDAGACGWLLERCLRRSGFAAARGVPIADLLSTATALHALSLDPRSLDAVREPCRRFVNSVWRPKKGGFSGHALDLVVDCEYTWYGLLALGHISGPSAT